VDGHVFASRDVPRTPLLCTSGSPLFGASAGRGQENVIARTTWPRRNDSIGARH